MTTTLIRPKTRPALKARDRFIGAVEDALERALPAAAEVPGVVHEAMRYCVLSGGKRFRPLLCLGAAEAVGAPARKAMPTACAVELIHTYSLVHDDLPAMDNTDVRRGQASCHRKFGEANAILVGDALLTLAIAILGRNNGGANSLEIVRVLGEAAGTAGLIGGQVLDLQAISRPHSANERVWRDIAQRKTASLIAASVSAGALAGGGSAEQVRRLSRYGRNVGLAFQLIDDVHDQEGLAQAMGTDAAANEARSLIGQAIASLEPFGRRGQTLKELAEWIAGTLES